MSTDTTAPDTIVLIERVFARAPEDIRRSIRWLPIGAAVELAA